MTSLCWALYIVGNATCFIRKRLLSAFYDCLYSKTVNSRPMSELIWNLWFKHLCRCSTSRENDNCAHREWHMVQCPLYIWFFKKSNCRNCMNLYENKYRTFYQQKNKTQNFTWVSLKNSSLNRFFLNAIWWFGTYYSLTSGSRKSYFEP